MWQETREQNGCKGDSDLLWCRGRDSNLILLYLKLCRVEDRLRRLLDRQCRIPDSVKNL